MALWDREDNDWGAGADATWGLLAAGTWSGGQSSRQVP